MTIGKRIFILCSLLSSLCFANLLMANDLANVCLDSWDKAFDQRNAAASNIVKAVNKASTNKDRAEQYLYSVSDQLIYSRKIAVLTQERCLEVTTITHSDIHKHLRDLDNLDERFECSWEVVDFLNHWRLFANSKDKMWEYNEAENYSKAKVFAKVSAGFRVKVKLSAERFMQNNRHCGEQRDLLEVVSKVQAIANKYDDNYFSDLSKQFASKQ